MMGLDELDLEERIVKELTAISERMHRDARRRTFLERMRLLLRTGATVSHVRVMMTAARVRLKERVP